MKRKIPANAANGVRHKKVKTHTTEEVKPITSKRSKIAEVETDSDPIVESDTASQSGDDDGVSWPSDEEQKEELEDNEDGGIKIAADAANHEKPANFEPTNNTLPCL